MALSRHRSRSADHSSAHASRPESSPAPPDETSRRIQCRIEALVDAAQIASHPEEPLGRARGLIFAEATRLRRSGGSDVSVLDQPSQDTARLYYEIGDPQAAADLLDTIPNPKARIEGWMELFRRGHAEVFEPMLRVVDEYDDDPLLQDALLSEMRDTLTAHQGLTQAKIADDYRPAVGRPAPGQLIRRQSRSSPRFAGHQLGRLP